MYNNTNQWGQAFDHWCLAVFSFWYTGTWLYLYIGVTFVFFLSFPLSLPFDWTLRYWVCCFVLLYFECFVMLCYVMLCIKKKMLITNKKKSLNCEIKCCSYLSYFFILWQKHAALDLHKIVSNLMITYSSIESYESKVNKTTQFIKESNRR